jgi:hypothetical protein
MWFFFHDELLSNIECYHLYNCIANYEYLLTKCWKSANLSLDSTNCKLTKYFFLTIQNSFTQFYVSQLCVALTRVRNRRSVSSLFMTRSANETVKMMTNLRKTYSNKSTLEQATLRDILIHEIYLHVSFPLQQKWKVTSLFTRNTTTVTT